MGRRRGQGRADGRWQRGQRRGPLRVAAVWALVLPSCSAAVSATGGPQGAFVSLSARLRVQVRTAVCLSECLWVGAQMLFKSCVCLCPREACPCP